MMIDEDYYHLMATILLRIKMAMMLSMRMTSTMTTDMNKDDNDHWYGDGDVF